MTYTCTNPDCETATDVPELRWDGRLILALDQCPACLVCVTATDRAKWEEAAALDVRELLHAAKDREHNWQLEGVR